MPRPFCAKFGALPRRTGTQPIVRREELRLRVELCGEFGQIDGERLPRHACLRQFGRLRPVRRLQRVAFGLGAGVIGKFPVQG
ncbi:hypothetical protein [Cupriavidus sp. D39]|uniref:hypothetical protein n=1 Tax=Cupriavidus sp. D39 TaxID=2997877 RepID=UPI00226FE1A7|nr:hypothetical protein [Cupriavidus sp. D39]MCY0854044.1 hypothetical protein [Cupriavidus sp. D39]